MGGQTFGWPSPHAHAPPPLEPPLYRPTAVDAICLGVNNTTVKFLNLSIIARKCVFLTSKCTKMRLSAGLRPDPLPRPRPPSWKREGRGGREEREEGGRGGIGPPNFQNVVIIIIIIIIITRFKHTLCHSL